MILAPHRWSLAMALMLIAAAAPGCGRKATSTAAKAPTPPIAPPTPAPPGPVTPFCILQLALEQATPPPSRIAGLEGAVLKALPGALMGIKAVAAVAPDKRPASAAECAADAELRGRVGVLIRFDYVLFDEDMKSHLPSAPDGATQMHVAVMAHAERQGPGNRPEIAEAHVSARVPMPARHASDLLGFARVRVLRAARLAVTDALGQLWVRRMEDGQIEALLDDKDPFQRAAAVREVGERGMLEARPKVEKAALSSRRDLAVVAAAALGRLADAASLPTLRSCLESTSPEVIDAAMVAISEISDPRARKMLEQVAKGHPVPWIRQRAGALLER